MHAHKDMFRLMHARTVYMRKWSPPHRILSGTKISTRSIVTLLFVLMNSCRFLLSHRHYRQGGCCFFVWKREMLPSCERRVRVSGVSLTVVCRRMEKGVKVGKGRQVGRVGCLWQRGRAECHHDLPNQGPEPNRAKREKMRVLGGVGSELKGRRGCCQFLRNLLSLLSSPPSPILLPLEKWGQGVNVMQHAEYSKWALWYSDRRICSTLLGS